MRQLLLLMIALASLLGCQPLPPTAAATVIELLAPIDFIVQDSAGFVPAYHHQGKQALAINAGVYKDKFALASTEFTGTAGVYAAALISLKETDGESTYRVFRGAKEVAEVQNAPTTTDYEPQTHTLGKLRLRPGDRLSVAFNSSSNGKIPEGDAFAFARGRWTMLRLVKIR